MKYLLYCNMFWLSLKYSGRRLYQYNKDHFLFKFLLKQAVNSMDTQKFEVKRSHQLKSFS